jgi:hypothetical protein
VLKAAVFLMVVVVIFLLAEVVIMGVLTVMWETGALGLAV